MVIFNKGDLSTYDKIIDNAIERDVNILFIIQSKIKSARNILEQKIRLMTFLETVFGLPKNNRVLSF